MFESRRGLWAPREAGRGGGPFATLCPEELRGKVDVLVVGEAEYTSPPSPPFVRDYEAGVWQAEYRQQESPSMLDSPRPTLRAPQDHPVPQHGHPVRARLPLQRTSPRRVWLTVSMCLETACRRPRAIRHAFTLALMHKHFYEYVQETSRALDRLMRELRKAEPAP